MKEHCWWRSRLALARKGLLSAVLTQAVAKGGTEAGGRNNLARFVRILQKQIKRVLRLDGYPTATSLRPPIIPLHRVSAQLISSHK